LFAAAPPGRRHRPAPRRPRPDPLLETSPALRREALGVVGPARNIVGIEDPRRRHHRTGQRSPARLVAAGNRPHPALERRALAAEGGADVLVAERQARDLDGGAARWFPSGGVATGCFPTGALATHGAMVRAGRV